MSTTRAFEEAYTKLNAKQKEAVDAVYGPVMVIAGPGTGKTQILALRIGTILLKATGAKPDEILALTFTESAAATLRTRLISFIGSAAYRVHIHTFHGFARSILEMRPDLFPRIALGARLDEVRGIAVMERLLDQGSYTKIRNPKFPHRAAPLLLRFMGKLKQERYSPEQYLAALTKEHGSLLADPARFHASGSYEGKEKGEFIRKRERIEKHIEAARLFGEYEKALERESLYDYEDLIGVAVRGLESDEGFRAEVGERFQFVLADEHQDANPAQDRLLELVTDFDGSPNLFIVGDERQAIYRFQGASLASFLYFKEKYPDARVLALTDNYRSTANVLAAAHDLMASAPGAASHPVLRPVRGNGGTIEEAVCDTPREEREAIRVYIEKAHDSGVPYEHIAILTRKNADVLALAEFLRGQGIPEDHASAEISALAHPAVKLLIALIRGLAEGDDISFARALFMPGAPGELRARIRLVARAGGEKPLMRVLEVEGGDMRAWAHRLAKLSDESSATPLIAWLTRLASESGFLAGVLALGESEDAYEAYQGLMDEAALVSREHPSATARDFLRHLSLIEKHELDVKRARTKRAGIRLMTVHRAKGLEFPYVIIAHATDERWMRGRADEFSLLLEREEDEHDERRLFYVALTRAKDGVLITRSEMTEEERAQTPLRFLADVAPHLKTANLPATLPEAPKHSVRSVLDREFLTERLMAQGFSPTAFNNFERSPWQYYFRNLLRLPDTPTLPMHLGTAVHAGLESYASALTKRKASVVTAVEAFHAALSRLPLSSLDRTELARTGETALCAYVKQESEHMKRIHEFEFAVSAVLHVPGVGDIPLSGKLDRLDLKSDGTVEVIDYKTGRAKSENEIRGLTKKGDRSQYRQLVFYKLLLDKDGRFDMREGSLHYVEPEKNGACVIRQFRITGAEAKALEQELIHAAQAIADGSAFTASCDPETCDYCDLVEFLVAEKPATDSPRPAREAPGPRRKNTRRSSR